MIFLIILLVLAIFGRYACGTICPLGIAQALLFKIPGFKKFTKLPHEEHLKKIKYFVFCALLIFIPLSYFYPVGGDNKIVALTIKIVGFSLIIIASLFIYRPFCKYICPIGVFLGLFNKISPFRYKVKNNCVNCKMCSRKCLMGVDPSTNPNSIECIRCGKCLKSCPKKSIERVVFDYKNKEDVNNDKIHE